MRTTIIGSSFKNEKPLYLKPWGHPPKPQSASLSVPIALKFLAHLFPGYISWPQSLCLHFWEKLDHQELNRSVPLCPFKNPPVGPHCALDKANSLSAFTRCISTPFSSLNTLESHTPCASKEPGGSWSQN